jgi:hypothetical protein
MNYNDLGKYKGTHAMFGASQYSWINYPDPKMIIEKYKSKKAADFGTKIHEIAAKLITLCKKLPKSYPAIRLLLIYALGYDTELITDIVMDTLRMYVNDAIGFGMDAEQLVFYSEYFYGTADAISMSETKSLLRIHDLKTGKTPARLEQLLIYAAYYCLQHDKDPRDLFFELRIYQQGDVIIGRPTAAELTLLMNKIITFNKVIQEYESER